MPDASAKMQSAKQEVACGLRCSSCEGIFDRVCDGCDTVHITTDEPYVGFPRKCDYCRQMQARREWLSRNRPEMVAEIDTE